MPVLRCRYDSEYLFIGKTYASALHALMSLLYWESLTAGSYRGARDALL